MLAIAHPRALAGCGPLPCRVEVTRRPGHARELARTARDGVLAVGGDGTVHEVVNGLMDAGLTGPLALAPFGSGNDTARGLGITRSNWREICQHGLVRRVDLGCLEPTGAAPVHFLGAASVGFAAHASRWANRLPRGWPGLYVAGTALALPRLRRHAAWLTRAGESVPLRLLNLNLANLPYFGGGMLAAPEAVPDDGLLDVVAMECSLGQVLRHFPRLYTGNFAIPGITCGRFDWLRVDCETALPLQVDGELLGTSPATCRVVPRALDCLLP